MFSSDEKTERNKNPLKQKEESPYEQLRRRNSSSFGSKIKGFFSFLITLTVLYFIYSGAYFTFYYFKMNDGLKKVTEMASLTTDIETIQLTVLKICNSTKEVVCDVKSFKIERDFNKTYISMKYHIPFKILWKYPIELSFKPSFEKEY